MTTRRLIKGTRDIHCLIPSAFCILGLLACCEAYEFGQLGAGLSWFRLYTVPNPDELVYFKEPMAFLREILSSRS